MAVHNWRLKKGVDLFLLGGVLILFKFDSFEDAKEVMHRDLRRFLNKLSLQRWSLKMVCSRSVLHAKEVWVRLVRLPLHLWEMTLFKYLGDCCESFVAVDEDIVSRHNLQWTRILVRLDGKKVLGSLQVVVGRLSTIRFSCGGRPRLGYLRL